MPIHILIEEGQRHLHLLEENCSNFGKKKAAILEPVNRKIEQAQSSLLKCQENSAKIEHMLAVLDNKSSIGESIVKTKDQLTAQTLLMDDFMVRYNQKINEQQRTNTQIGETMKEIKAVQNKLQKMEAQKQVVEYYRLKKENDEMY